jgi:hypothetical protein
MSHVQQVLWLGGLRLFGERASAVRCDVNTVHMRLTSACLVQSASQPASPVQSVSQSVCTIVELLVES